MVEETYELSYQLVGAHGRGQDYCNPDKPSLSPDHYMATPGSFHAGQCRRQRCC